MKRISYVITLAAILCLFNVRGYAYAFSAKNAQGVTLYYNYINDGLELELTHGENKYPAKLIIPEEVTFMNRTRKVTKIGASTFWYGGQDLTSITLPQSITAIGDQAFNHCFFLTSIQLPSNLKSIGESAFNYCEQLKSITIPSSVTEIGSYAFYRCKALTSIVLPDGIKKIESHTFEGCSALKSITIPEGVTKIDYEAFKECEKLTSLTIPSSVTAIESGAFNGINIETITIYNRHPFYIREKKDIGTSQFNQNTYNNATLYVPTGSKDVYKSTRGWSDFLFIEEKDLVIPESEQGSQTDESLSKKNGAGYSFKITSTHLEELKKEGTAFDTNRLEKGMTMDQVVSLIGSPNNWSTTETTTLKNGKTTKEKKLVVKNVIVENAKQTKVLTLYFGEDQRLSHWTLE